MKVADGPDGFSVEAVDFTPAPSRSDPFGDRGYIAVKFSGGLYVPYDGSSKNRWPAITALLEHISEHVTSALKIEPNADTGPVTVEELLRRGVSYELEGRAIDVILRCGWPRPGDVLGLKPCIPIAMHDLKHVLEAAKALDGRRFETRFNDVCEYLERQLKVQEYVQTLYLGTAAIAEDPQLKWPPGEPAD